MTIVNWIIVGAGTILLLYIASMHYRFEREYKAYKTKERELINRLEAMLDYYLAGQPYGNTQKGFLLWLTEQAQKQKGHTHDHEHDTGTDQRNHTQGGDAEIRE